MRAARGQGTVEYLAVVLVVALVVGAAAALTVGTGLGEQVVGAIRRALCVVAGGPCDEDVAGPCVRSSRQHADGGQLTVLVGRVGSREVELRELRADGSVAVTLVDEKSAGIDVGSGVEVHVRWGTSSRALGAELRAAMLAERSSGRTWIAPNAAAADRLVERVRLADLSRRPQRTIELSPERPDFLPRRPEVRAPPPDVTFSERGAELSFAAHRFGRDVRGGVAETYGERVERRSGRRTVYMRERARGRASLAISRVGASGEGEAEVRYGISLDRDGRPLDLEVLSALDVRGAVGLPAPLAAIAGLLRVPAGGERHVETEQHLDLTDPANRAAVEAYLAGGADGSAAALAAADLRARLERRGTVRVRTYEAQDSAHAVGAHAKLLGVGVGAEGGSEDATARLRSAAVRAAGGSWRDDLACLPSA